jgi:hypothetical protein
VSKNLSICTTRAPALTLRNSDNHTPERTAAVLTRTPRTVSSRTSLTEQRVSDIPLARPSSTVPLVRRESNGVTPRRVSETTTTPRRVSSTVRQPSVDLPTSPSQLADVADQSFTIVRERATELWDRSRIDEWKEYIRENVSSVSAIQTLILVIEASGLQWNTLGTIYAFDTSSSPALRLPSRSIHLPDPTLLLTSNWWGPATLWSLTSWVLPLLFSYFFNLTLRTNTNHKSASRQSTIDPLTFNIVKAILAYSAYHISTQADVALTGQPNAYEAQNLAWGPFDASSVSTVRNNVPGGYYGLQIGAVVGVLTSLYDAALRK